MKILIINKTFKEFGGIETHINDLISELEKYGHSIIKFDPRKCNQLVPSFPGGLVSNI